MSITPPYTSVLSGISPDAPAFTRSHKILTKAAENGFKWPNAASVLKKIGEELDEIGAAERKGDTGNLKEEIGDALSATVTLLCFTGADAEGLVIPSPQPDVSRPFSMDTLNHSLAALREAVAADNQDQIRHGLSQLLTGIVSFAHERGVDAQAALQDTNDKFVYRFDHVGRSLHTQGRSMADASLKEMVGLWNQCKPPVAETAALPQRY